MVQETFSKARLESVMLSQGVNYKEISDYIGYDVESLVNSKNGLPANVVRKVADYLKCDKGYLYMENNDPKLKEITPDPEPKNIKTKGKGGQVPHYIANPSVYKKYELLPDRVEAQRKKMGWSKIMLCEFVGDVTTSYTQLVYEKRLPISVRIDDIKRLCKYLHCDEKYLSGKTDKIDHNKIKKCEYKLNKQHYLVYSSVMMKLNNNQINEISKLTGISASMISEMKRRRVAVSDKTLKELVKAMNIVCDVTYTRSDIASDLNKKESNNKKDNTVTPVENKPQKEPEYKPQSNKKENDDNKEIIEITKDEFFEILDGFTPEQLDTVAEYCNALKLLKTAKNKFK